MRRRRFLMLGAGALGVSTVSARGSFVPVDGGGVSRGTEETCGGCRFWWTPSKRSVGGECRRHAPVEQVRSHLNGGGHVYEMLEKGWPSMLRSGWCGDWEATEVADGDR